MFLPRGVPHTFALESDVPGRVLTLMSPGGGERFFVEGGRPAEHEGLPDPGPIDVEALRLTSARFGSEIVGPPLAVAQHA